MPKAAEKTKTKPKLSEAPFLTKRINIWKFSSPHCGPCIALDKARTIERFAEAHASDVSSRNVDVHEAEALADEFDIRATPTIVFVDSNGEEFDRIEGPPTLASLTKMYRYCLAELKAEDAERGSQNEEDDEEESDEE